MRQHARIMIASIASIVLSTVSIAAAHVRLDQPNGGEQLQVGTIYEVQWTVVGGNYNPQNWDLWYSTTGPDGPWQELAMDLPPGDGTNGAVHTYAWLVPDDVSDQVRVRVRMDNAGFDYEDISDNDLSIVDGILLQQSPLTRGKTASFLVTNAISGEQVYVLYSVAGSGQGPSVPQLGGLELDLLKPVRVIGTAQADGNGRALVQRTIPVDAPIVDLVWTQAVIRRGDLGSESIKSNWIEAPLK